jgi:excinuclease ABC subunit A
MDGNRINATHPDDDRLIVVRGARQNKLKNIDIELPRNRLVVFTGPSGSGKSSLAFDTIYAEGQRRYVESLSAYARQFLERMDKPDVDFMSGLSPSIAIEQRSSPKNPRSTVATQTELFDHLRLLYARIGRTVSPVSGKEVLKDSPRSVANTLTRELPDGQRFYLCVRFPKHKGRSKNEEMAALQKRGFSRIIVLPTDRQLRSGRPELVVDLSREDTQIARVSADRLLVLLDRLAIRHDDGETVSRIADSVEAAFREGMGRCTVVLPASDEPSGLSIFDFSGFFETDGLVFVEPTPQLFSFNSPIGACPECQGFGSVPGLDEDLIVPNPRLSLREGALAPFASEQWRSYYRELVRVALNYGLSIDKPYADLSAEERDIVWNGRDDYVGLNGFFDFLKKHSYKMHYRIYSARFRGYTRCPECQGYRLRSDALHVKLSGMHIGEVCELTIKGAYRFFRELTLTEHETSVAGRVLEEIRKRLQYLNEVGLDYLTLDRLSHTLSGGESQRINLATSLGSSLVGSLYVLDEPSIGLHPRDTDRLVRILEHLRDIGNTVFVVEHDPDTIRRADQVVDMGPGAGLHGGHIVFQGDLEALLKDAGSLTGAYLSGRKRIELPAARRQPNEQAAIGIKGARGNNLKRIDVRFPLGLMTCVTGVSGSGKSTLVRDTLFSGLRRIKGSYDLAVAPHDAILGHHLIDNLEFVDQSPIGKSPRSNAVTYIKVFSAIRELMAATHEAQLKGYKPGYFSFNIAGGRCEACQGEGFVKIEMQFLADLYLECEACRGKRYGKEALNIRYRGKNIDDILHMTVEEAAEFFADTDRIASKLRVLIDVGLGYLMLGQPATTLSGGEAQRVKLAAHLARPASGHTLYVFDEPTIGLHFDDIRKLLAAFDALIAGGHTVVLIEHNLDVIKCADWIIDLGPEGGMAGGKIVCEGPPELVGSHPDSQTGRFLRDLLPA